MSAWMPDDEFRAQRNMKQCIVQDVPENCDNEQVKAAAGPGVEHVKWQDRNGWTGKGFLTFSNQDEAKAAGSKGTINIAGTSCTIEWCGQKELDKQASGWLPTHEFRQQRDQKQCVVNYLPEDSCDDDVREAFSKFTIENMKWQDRNGWSGKGFLTFESVEDAKAAADMGTFDIKGTECSIEWCGGRDASSYNKGGKGKGGKKGGKGGKGKGGKNRW